MRVVITMVLALVPLAIAPGLLFYFDTTPKLALILLGSSALLLFHRQNVENLRMLLANAAGRWFAILVLAEWLSLAGSTLLSTNAALSTFGSAWRRLGLLSYTAILVFVLLGAAWIAADRKNVVFFLRSIALGGAIGSAYGIAQYFGWDPLIPAKHYLAGEGPYTIVRPPGTLGHADYFAAWLVIVVFCSLTLVRIEERALARRLAAGVVAAGMTAILLSGTRGAMLATAAGFIYCIARLRPRVSSRSAIGAAAVVLITAAFIASPPGTRVRARIHWSLDDVSGGARLLLWRDSLILAGQRPGIGFGPEAFASKFPRAESLALAREYPDFYHESPHNVFLDALVQQGIPGAAILLCFCLLGLYGAQASRSRAAIPLGAGVVAALVCHQFTVFLPATALFFFSLLAALAGLPSEQLKRTHRFHPYLLIPLGVVLAVGLAGAAVRMLVSDCALSAANANIEAGNAEGAARQYRLARGWQLPGHGADLAYSRSMASLAARSAPGQARATAWHEAMESAHRAVETSDDAQNAWYNLAILLSAENDWAGVEKSLRAAIAVAPAWFKPHWALARLLELSNRHREALAEAADALKKDGGKDQEVVDTWRALSKP